MAKPTCVMETVNDLHGDLINLARIIAHPQLGSQLYRRLRRTLMHEQTFKDAAERYKTRGYWAPAPEPDYDLPRAYDYFICSWIGRNGCAGTGSYNQGFCLRFTANGGHAAKRWQSVVDSIPAWRRRLACVTILQRDAFELLPRIDDHAGTAIYIDPPYLEKGAKYIHDFEEGDHKRLAELLKRFVRARVVVSYYDHPKLAELYQGWGKVIITITKSLDNQNRRDKQNKGKQVDEVLLINDFGPKKLFN